MINIPRYPFLTYSYDVPFLKGTYLIESFRIIFDNFVDWNRLPWKMVMFFRLNNYFNVYRNIKLRWQKWHLWKTWITCDFSTAVNFYDFIGKTTVLIIYYVFDFLLTWIIQYIHIFNMLKNDIIMFDTCSWHNFIRYIILHAIVSISSYILQNEILKI